MRRMVHGRVRSLASCRPPAKLEVEHPDSVADPPSLQLMLVQPAHRLGALDKFDLGEGQPVSEDRPRAR
jgi:hypothetical protein